MCIISIQVERGRYNFLVIIWRTKNANTLCRYIKRYETLILSAHFTVFYRVPIHAARKNIRFEIF